MNRRNVKNIPFALVLATLSAAPIVFLFITVYKYAVDIPWWDMWSWIYVIENYYDGSLSFADFFMQHNEHRLVFPKLLFLPIVLVGKWQTLHFSILSMFFSFALLAVISSQVMSIYKQTNDNFIFLSIPFVSAILFSLSMAHNWLWSGQFQIYMNVLFAVVGLTLISSTKFKLSKYFLAVVCGIIATFSFANGLFFWVCGLFPLYFFTKGLAKRERLKYVSLWLTVSALVIVFYLNGYERPAWNPDPLHFLGNPQNFFRYIFVYLSSSMAINLQQAYFLTSFGLANISISTYLLVKMKYVDIKNLLPLVSISLYAIMSAIITAAGRELKGYEHAFSARYIIVSNLFVISNVLIAFVLVCALRNSFNLRFSLRLCTYFVFVLLLIVPVNSFVERSLDGYRHIQKYSSGLSYAKNSIIKYGVNDNNYRIICWDKNLVELKVNLLKKHKLSLFNGVGSD